MHTKYVKINTMRKFPSIQYMHGVAYLHMNAVFAVGDHYQLLAA